MSVCRLYVRLCRRFGPDGLTLSAAAHVRAMEGRPWWRNRIDGFWLLFFGAHNHAQSSWHLSQREDD